MVIFYSDDMKKLLWFDFIYCGNLGEKYLYIKISDKIVIYCIKRYRVVGGFKVWGLEYIFMR